MSSPFDLGRFVPNRLFKVTDTAAEVISLAELKAQARVDSADEDDLLTGYIKSARMYTERRIGRFIRTQTCKYRLEWFPGGSYIPLPRPPLTAIDHVKFKERDGTVTTLFNSLASPEVTTAVFSVELETEPGFIYLNPSESWPSESLFEGFPVEIQFQAGLSPVDEDLITAMKLLAAHWFEHREAAIVGSLAQMNALASATVPLAYEALVDMFIFMEG